MEQELSVHAILLFDGECNLCNHAVQFIIARDPKAYYRFAALQSAAGQHLLEQYQLPRSQFDTIIMIQNNQVYTKSTAALRIVRKLYRLWSYLYIFIMVPKLIRDPLYDWIARNRIKWFGRRDSCMMPTPEIKMRFLE
jgi:predicted DCC family thiol-disulfide oxidoreductase YuxK